VLEAFTFQRAISKPAVAKVIDLGTGFELMQFKTGTKENPCPTDIDELEFKLAEELALIQSKAQVLIPWPQGKITKEEIADIFSIAEIIRTGKETYPIESISGVGDRKMAENILAISEFSGTWKTVSKGDETVDVVGQTISLGQMMTICRGVLLTAEHRAELQAQLENPSQEKFKFVFTAKEEAVLEKFYPKWMPKAEAEVIQQHMMVPPTNSQ
jgi:hypothetical protein